MPKYKSKPLDLPDHEFFKGYTARQFPETKPNGKPDGRVKIIGLMGRAVIQKKSDDDDGYQKWHIRVTKPKRRQLTLRVVSQESAIEAAIVAIRDTQRKVAKAA